MLTPRLAVNRFWATKLPAMPILTVVIMMSIRRIADSVMPCSRTGSWDGIASVCLTSNLNWNEVVRGTVAGMSLRLPQGELQQQFFTIGLPILDSEWDRREP